MRLIVYYTYVICLDTFDIITTNTAFRIGQRRDVVVYRLIMASSIEEKMYEKQVFKDGLRVVSESGESSKYFSEDDTKVSLFPLTLPYIRYIIIHI